MKKILALILVLLFSTSLLCGCGHFTNNEHGQKVQGRGRFVFLECVETGDQIWLAYDVETKIVYFYDDTGYNAGLHGNYYIYEGDAIYGAIYENGEIKPVPIASITP